MVKALIERGLRRVFGAQARDPDPSAMTTEERRQAEAANMPKGAPLASPLADGGSAIARRDAMQANEKEPVGMHSPRADGTHTAEVDARFSNEEDGSYLESDLADSSHTAENDAEMSGPHERPRSGFASDTETAREDAARANEPSKKGDTGV